MFARLSLFLLLLLAAGFGGCAPSAAQALAPAAAGRAGAAREPAPEPADDAGARPAANAAEPSAWRAAAAATGAVSPSCPPSTGSLWQVEVVEASSTMEFGPYYLAPDSGNQLVSVTLAYSFLGTGSATFYPESVVLVHAGEGSTGWAQLPSLHQTESWSDTITNFADASVVVTVYEGRHVSTVKFAFEFPAEFSEFKLFFPGSDPIDISLS